MDYASTNSVFEAVKGQVSQEVDSLDDIVIFDGPLSRAIEEHFASVSGGSRFAFITLADGAADAISGYGLPVREGLLVDIYLVFRIQGRGGYDQTRQDMWDAADTIIHDAFRIDKRSAESKKVLAGTQFVARVRQLPGGDMLSQLIRFIITPARAL